MRRCTLGRRDRLLVDAIELERAGHYTGLGLGCAVLLEFVAHEARTMSFGSNPSDSSASTRVFPVGTQLSYQTVHH